MRTLVVLVLAGLLSGCTVALRLDVLRADAAPRPLPAAAGAAAGAPALGVYLSQYRDELERLCATGVLAAEECSFHRNRLLELMEAHLSGALDSQRLTRAQALADAAEGSPVPEARGRLGMVALAILRVVRGR